MSLLAEETPVSIKKSNHQANIVRISELLPHNNSDNLALVKIGGYQVVVRKDQFKIGDLAVYIQPDSVVPQTEPFRFIWEQYATCSVCGNGWGAHKMSCYPEYPRKASEVPVTRCTDSVIALSRIRYLRSRSELR